MDDSRVLANIKDGDVVELKRSGMRYRISNLHATPYGGQGTITRVVPKPKGKAARKAAKRARRERIL